MASNKKSAGKKTASKKNTAAKRKKNRKMSSFSVYMITLLIITIVLGIFMYIDTGDGGMINNAVKSAVCGIFGIMGYFVPVCFAGFFIYLGIYKDINKLWIKIILTFLAIIDVSSIIGLTKGFSVSDALYEGANNGHGGGFIGAAVGNFFNEMLQNVLSYIILSIGIVVLAGFIANVPVWKYAANGIKEIISRAGKGYKSIKTSHENRNTEDEFSIPKLMPKGHEDMPENNKTEKFNDIPIIDAEEKPQNRELPDFMQQDEKKTKKRLKFVEPEEQELPEFTNGIDEVFANLENANEPELPETDEVPFVDKSIHAKNQNVSSVQEELESYMSEEPKNKRRSEKITEEEKQSYSEELNNAIDTAEKIEYVFPDIELLNEPKSAPADLRTELRRTAENLITILSNFNVKARLLQVTQGPTVTRYEIQPDTGVKLSKIVGLADDIAMNLAVPTVLVAPVPGKAAVGIEIPNKKVTSVSIREMLESDEFRNAKSSLTVALGKDIGGNVVVGNIAKWPHMLIAGATGSGKSVCINTIITSILYKASPDEVRLIMVDPKVVELGVYNGIPHLLIPVVTDPKKAAGALNWAVAEMMRRYDLFKETGVRKLESYNKLMESRGGEKIPQLVIIIDELADLMMVAAKEVEDYICRLAQLARAAGIHLIIATQRPSVDVITGLIKANIPSRIAFSVSSQVDSRTILDKSGAEKLLGMGDMLYFPTGARSPMRLQGAFVDDPEIERIIDFIKGSIGETHYSEDLAEQIERCASGENGVTPDAEDDGDVLLPDAIQLAVELGKISTSMIQRRLGVGYSRAGRIIDQMEARGIISGANGSKPRDVLVSHADMAAAGISGESYGEE